MHRTAVESTTLATVGYDKTHKLLLLAFRSRATYQYFGVPAELHQALLDAPSKGSYFNRFVRGRFPYSLVHPGREDVAGTLLTLPTIGG
jgi:KTSC domain